MVISKGFKSLNLKKKMRKLFTDEVGGVKMKKNEKDAFCNSKNGIFCTCFLAALLTLHFRDDL